MDNPVFMTESWSLMSIPTSHELQSALRRDLRKPGAKTLAKVVDDSARKVFTTSMDGAVFVFAHKQPDPAYWVGMKNYASGPSSRVRIRRNPASTASHVQ